MVRIAVVLLFALGCGAGDRDLSPSDLELRDLLGVSAEVARDWSDSEQAEARALIEDGLAREIAGEEVALDGDADDARLIAAMIRVDDRRFDRGEPVIAVATGSLADHRIEIDPVAAYVAIEGTETELLASLGAAAGAPEPQAVEIREADRAPFVALYIPGRRQLLVNPVVLAVLEASEDTAQPAVAAASGVQTGAPERAGSPARATAGNPYSFFGSVSECASAQRTRCESCIAAGSCDQQSRDATSGLDECQTLAADNGVGYFLFCVNLSLAIETVADCTAGTTPGCSRVTTASNQVAALEANRVFVDDPICLAGLDQCLSTIFGEPDDDFPAPPADAGPAPPPPPPPARDTDIGCGSQECSFDPQCNASCDGPECGQLFSCQADCGDDDSGCSSCESEDGGGCESGGGSDSGGCGGSDDSGGGGGGGGGCGGSDDGGGGGGCGGSDDSGGGGSGSSGCDSGSCDGGSCDSGSCDSGDCGSSGGGSCSVARAERRRNAAALSLMWAGLPLMFLGLFRRRRSGAGRDADGGQQ